MKAKPNALYTRLKKARKLDEFMVYAAENSIADCVTWCQQAGIRTSSGAVSRCYAQHSFAWRLERAKAAAEATQSLPGMKGDFEEKKSQLLQQKIFEALADADCPPKVLIALRGLELEAKKVKLAERRVTVLEKKLKEVEKVAHSSLTDEEQAQRIRTIFKKK
jgi:hypothetical protein